MRENIHRSRSFVCALILLFLCSLTVEAWGAYSPYDTKNDGKPVVRVKRAGGNIPAHQVERFEELFTEGKRLLQEEFDYEGAIGKFTEALRYAALKEQRAEVYFYLSLAYYAMPDPQRQEDFVDMIKKLIESDYYWELDETVCPRRYIERYQEIKREYGALRILSNPSGADVYLGGSRTSAGKTPLTIGAREGDIEIEIKRGSATKKDSLRVVAGKETTSPEYILKGKSSTLYIVGGLVLAGGLGAALLLGGGSEEPGPSPTPTPTTGSLQINSQPSGATIFLDGSDTGRTTNATLTDLSPGSHAIRLTKEGYEEYEETASVVAGQTTTVNAPLQPHQIRVILPARDDFLTKRKDIEIRWEVSGLNTLDKSTGSRRRLYGGTNSLQRSASMTQRRALRLRNILGMRENNRQRSETLRISRQRTPRTADFSSSVGDQAGIKAKAHMNNPRSIGPLSERGRLPRSDLRDPVRGDSKPHLKKHASSTNKVHPATLTNVRIELYRSGDPVKTISSNTENDGLHIWTVNSSIQDGPDYIIRVSSKSEPDVYGESEEFSILGAGNFDEHFDDDTFVKSTFTESHPTSWKVEGGVYKADKIAGNARSWSFFNPGDYSDFTCEVKAGNGNSHVFYGIAFRGTDNFRNFYFYYVSTEGTWELKKLTNSTSEEVLVQMTSSAIQTGFNKWNRLKVEATGHNLKFYINDILVHSAFFGDLSLTGKIGLVTRINYPDVKFDDLSVRIIE